MDSDSFFWKLIRLFFKQNNVKFTYVVVKYAICEYLLSSKTEMKCIPYSSASNLSQTKGIHQFSM